MLTPPHTQPAVDLDACDREPIHHIGVVQPHVGEKDEVLAAAQVAKQVRDVEPHAQVAHPRRRHVRHARRALVQRPVHRQPLLERRRVIDRLWVAQVVVKDILNVEKGERVVGTLQMAGTEMMRIANLSSMEVQVDVSENDILKVSVQDEADIEVDAYLGRKFKGRVTEIANSASNVSSAAVSLNTDQVTNFVVKIRVDPASYAELMGKGKLHPFRPGMSASVDIYTNTADSTLSIPLIAVTTREDEKDKDKDKDKEEKAKEEDKKDDSVIKEIVFVVTGDTVGIREVKTGIQDNDFIEVLSGLQEGETIVTGPYSAVARKLKGGSRIIVSDKKKGDDNKKGVSVEVD